MKQLFRRMLLRIPLYREWYEGMLRSEVERKMWRLIDHLERGAREYHFLRSLGYDPCSIRMREVVASLDVGIQGFLVGIQHCRKELIPTFTMHFRYATSFICRPHYG